MKISVASIIFLLVWLPSVQARTIYTYELYDTNDPSAGSFIQTAEAQIEAFVSSAIPEAMGSTYTLSRNRFDGESFSIDGLRASLNPIQGFEEDDVVLLFYVGHGLDDPNSKLPMLQIPDVKNSKTQFPAQRIIDAISSRKPKTFIALFEACNVDPKLQLPSGGSNSSYDHDKIRAILNSSFGVAIASAKEGQYSFISADGGVFSNRFLNMFRVESKIRNSDSLISAASERILVNSPSQPYQEPWVNKLW